MASERERERDPDELTYDGGVFCDRIGLTDLSPATLNLSKLAASNAEPVLIITSVGSDPSDELRTLAKQATAANCEEMAMGGEDDQLSRELEAALREQCKRPKWIVLKNVHLSSAPTLASLEKQLKWLQSADGVHGKFAVWMTTEPCADKIQNALVERCVKVAYEAPHGVKKNMRRAYDGWRNEHVRRTTGTSDETRSVYALAWFHSIVLERSTYIPQGWSQYYGFNDSDLSATLNVLHKSIRRGE